MKVKVLSSGKHDNGNFWTRLQSVDADGFIATAFATSVKALTADKEGFVTLPKPVFDKLRWEY